MFTFVSDIQSEALPAAQRERVHKYQYHQHRGVFLLRCVFRKNTACLDQMRLESFTCAAVMGITHIQHFSELPD